MKDDKCKFGISLESRGQSNFLEINFFQEKVLITGPAIDRILKEVHMQTSKNDSTGEHNKEKTPLKEVNI